MFHIIITEDAIISQAGTSEGTQVKYRKEDYWYKKDHLGQEGCAEYLSSRLLTFSDMDPSEYILYEQGMINGQRGCRSKNFLKPEEELVTFYRLYYNEYGKDLSQVISAMDTMEERIEYVIRFIRQSCDLDVTDYLRKTFTLDAIILNEDRHLNNLAVLLRNGQFVAAPIFDNGMSLLTGNASVNWRFPLEENVKRVIARPFSGSHEAMFRFFGPGFHLDYESALDWLAGEEPCRERDVLAFQVRRFQSLES